MYRQLCIDTDPMVDAIRRVVASQAAALALEEEAMASGAMKGEFVVVMRFRRRRGQFAGFGFVPFLK